MVSLAATALGVSTAFVATPAHLHAVPCTERHWLRYHSWRGGAPAGHGICNCQRLKPRSGLMDSHYWRLVGCGLGRLVGSSGWASWRVHRDCVRHCGATRLGRVAGEHVVRRCAAVCDGVVALGQLGALCAHQRGDWLYQRHCGAHCRVAAARLAWARH